VFSLILCPPLKLEHARADFNQVLTRIGGKALSAEDVANRAAYKAGLTPEQLDAYHRTYFLWDEHKGDAREILKVLPARNSILHVLETADVSTLTRIFEDFKAGENYDVQAVSGRLDSIEKARRANVLYRMNDEYGLAGIPETPVRALDLKEYDQLVAEANRRAWSEVGVEEKKHVAQQERAIHRQAEAEYETFKEGYLPSAIEDIKKHGGIILKSFSDYDTDTVKQLIRRFPGLISKDGKYSLDKWAMDYRFESADALMEKLLALPTKGEFIESWIADYEKAYGSASGFDAAEWQGRLLDKQLEIFNEMLKDSTEQWKNVSRPGIKKEIRESTGQVKVGDVMVSEYEALKAGILKAERASRTAFRAGKIEEAARQKEKQKELLDRYKAKISARTETMKAREEIKDVLKYFAKNPTLPVEYRDAIADLLGPLAPALGVKPPQASGELRAPIKAAIERATANGEMVPFEAEDLYEIRGRSFRDLTVDDLQDLATAAKILRHFAKIEDKQLSAGKAQSFNRLIWDLVVKGKETAYGRGFVAPRTPGEKLQAKAAGELESSWVTKYLFSLKRTEFINRDLDGWKYFGDHFDSMDSPLQHGVQAYLKMADEVNSRYMAAHEEFEKSIGMPAEKWLSKKVDIPGWPRPITRDMAMMAHASTLNEANLRTLRNIFTDEQIDFINSIITPAEEKLILEHADHFASFKSEIGKLSLELYGAEPKWVEDFYWPIKIDPDLDVSTEAMISESATRDLFKSAFDSPVIPTPFLKARKGTSRPADLSYAWILPRLQQQARWLSLAKPIRDVQRIVSRKEWMEMVISTRGRDAYDQYMPMLQDLANPNRYMPVNVAEKWIDISRRVSVMHALGFNVNSALKHFFEWMLSSEKLGFFNCLRGFGSFFSHPVENFRQVNELSVQMAHSHATLDRDVADFQAAIQGYKPWQRSFLNHAMDLITMADRAMRYSIWQEAYHQGIEGRNVWTGAKLDPEKAVDFADTIIRLTKPMTGAENLPSMFRGRGFSRLMSTFGTYFNGVLNNVWEDILRARYDPNYSPWDLLKALGLILIVTPLVTESATHKRMPKDLGEAAVWTGMYWSSMFPIFNQVANLALYSYESIGKKKVESRSMIGTEAIEHGAQAFLDALNYATGKPVEEYWWVNMAELLGTIPTTAPWGGFPPRQAITAAKGIIDLHSGKSDTYWSLMDRGAMYEGRPVGPRQRGMSLKY
jgi:hypothetical protein